MDIVINYKIWRGRNYTNCVTVNDNSKKLRYMIVILDITLDFSHLHSYNKNTFCCYFEDEVHLHDENEL